MEYTHLGRSGLSVSRLCLGTMNFGSLTPPGEAHAIMDHAHELGINFFDTANTYGRAQSPPGQVARNEQSHAGWTEEILGDWFAQGGGRRERTVLATKLYGDMGDMAERGQAVGAEHPPRLRRLAGAPADRLHRPVPDAPRRPRYPLGRDLAGDGGARHPGQDPLRGLVNFAGWHIARASETARARGLPGLVSEQSLYNLMTRAIELEVLPAARAYGVGRDPVVAAGGRAARRGV